MKGDFNKALNEILKQLQYGTLMSDNQEPMLTNNRNIAEQSILVLIESTCKKAKIDGLILAQTFLRQKSRYVKVYTSYISISELNRQGKAVINAKKQAIKKIDNTITSLQRTKLREIVK